MILLVSGVYDFNQDGEKARWVSTAFKAHANAMLDRWQEQDAKEIGAVKAKEKRQQIIQMAKTLMEGKK